jgi:prevent-host-death family protein
MKKVGLFEAKTHLSELVDQVEKGEEIQITRHGHVVAKLVPIKDPGSAERLQALDSLIRFGQGRKHL